MMKDPSLDKPDHIPLSCRFGWHWWPMWEGVGPASHPTGYIGMLEERCCCCCRKTQRRFAGRATLVEMAEAGRASAKVMTR